MGEVEITVQMYNNICTVAINVVNLYTTNVVPLQVQWLPISSAIATIKQIMAAISGGRSWKTAVATPCNSF